MAHTRGIRSPVPCQNPIRSIFAVVPTVKGQLLFVFVVLSLFRRRVLHLNVTAHPTAAWTAQQVVEALPWTTTAGYVVRDRDGIYGEGFSRRVAALGLEQVVIAARSPWQNAYAERFIGSITDPATT